jgi:hypothetical protein
MIVVGKPQIARSHIDTAVQLVAIDESYISAHLVIMAAEELLRIWYVKKDLYWPRDYRIIIKEEHHRDWLVKTREKYNFFKHADRDIDDSIDINPDDMRRLNDLLLLSLIDCYRHLFGHLTPTMTYFASWMCASYPEYVFWDKFPSGQ